MGDVMKLKHKIDDWELQALWETTFGVTVVESVGKRISAIIHKDCMRYVVISNGNKLSKEFVCLADAVDLYNKY
jgi:hypothetical protein